MEERPGHSIALNTGCRFATGSRIIFTDDDAFPHPHSLKAIHDTFHRYNCDWVYGPVIPRWEGGVAPTWYGAHTSRYVACLDYGNCEFTASKPEETFFGVNHACLRERIFELGLYREDLGIRPGTGSVGGNDDDLFNRALARGYKIVYDPRICVEHLIAAPRALKRTHRETIGRVASNQFLHMLEKGVEGPKFLGLPRYYVHKPCEHLSGWLRGVLSADPSLRFFHEIQLRRFMILYSKSLRHQLKRLFVRKTQTN